MNTMSSDPTQADDGLQESPAAAPQDAYPIDEFSFVVHERASRELSELSTEGSEPLVVAMDQRVVKYAL